jgi:hypothetical protein
VQGGKAGGGGDRERRRKRNKTKKQRDNLTKCGKNDAKTLTHVDG